MIAVEDNKPPPQKHSLRRNVGRLRDNVWCERHGRDAYTKLERGRLAEADQNVDHVIEVQIVEHAALGSLLENTELTNRVRDALNSAANLNVTSRKINQAKRGPFTAAINRLRKRDGTLREISVEQLARSRKAKWLVDNGSWENIRGEIVASYDRMEHTLGQHRLTRAQTKTLENVVEELHETLDKIKIF